MKKYTITKEEAQYFVFIRIVFQIKHISLSYKLLKILQKSGKVVDIAKASDQFNIKALSKPVTKYYICYPKA